MCCAAAGRHSASSGSFACLPAPVFTAGTGRPSFDHTRTYIGAASGNITTPLAALRAVLPGKDVSWDAGTADKFSTKNAKADAKRCEVSAEAWCVGYHEAYACPTLITHINRRALSIALGCRRRMRACCSWAAACRA